MNPSAAASSAVSSSASFASQARRLYRDLYRTLRHNPQRSQHWSQVQALYRSSSLPTELEAAASSSPTAEEQQQQQQQQKWLQQVEQKLSFYKMISPKVKPRGDTGRWIYHRTATTESEAGITSKEASDRPSTTRRRAVSSFDGNNLDPEAVSRHRQHLRRLGFVNNDHAKGIF